MTYPQFTCEIGIHAMNMPPTRVVNGRRIGKMYRSFAESSVFLVNLYAVVLAYFPASLNDFDID